MRWSRQWPYYSTNGISWLRSSWLSTGDLCSGNARGTVKTVNNGCPDELPRTGLPDRTLQSMIAPQFGSSAQNNPLVSKDWLSQQWLADKRKGNARRRVRQRSERHEQTGDTISEALSSFRILYRRSFFSRLVPDEHEIRVERTAQQLPASQHLRDMFAPGSPEEESLKKLETKYGKAEPGKGSVCMESLKKLETKYGKAEPGKGSVCMVDYQSGTYVVGLQTKNGVYICADSRATVEIIGPNRETYYKRVSDSAIKIHFLDHIAVGYAGDVEQIYGLHKIFNAACTLLKGSPLFNIPQLIDKMEELLGRENCLYDNVQALLMDRRQNPDNIITWDTSGITHTSGAILKMKSIGSGSYHSSYYIKKTLKAKPKSRRDALKHLCMSATHVFLCDVCSGDTFNVFFASDKENWSTIPILKLTTQQLIKRYPIVANGRKIPFIEDLM